MSGREHLVANQTDSGFEISVPDGTKIQCVLKRGADRPAMLDRVGEASCDSGWDGSVFFAHATLTGSGPFDRMVLMNDLWYAECPDNTPTDIGMGK